MHERDVAVAQPGRTDLDVLGRYLGPDVAAVVLPSGSNLTELLAATGKVEVKGYLMADGKTYKLVRIKLDN